MDEVKESDGPKFSVAEDPGFRVIHVDGVYGVLNSAGGQLTFYQDLMKVGVDENGSMAIKAVERVLVADIRMSPEVFRSTAYWMMEQAQDYEKWVVETFQQEESDKSNDMPG
jgi:hypothetical protein